MSHGFYCLIQYCPDASRAEAVNVGLLVYQIEPVATAVRVLDNVRPALKRLGQRAEAGTIRSLLESTKYRIERERFVSVESLEGFVRTRGNQIQLTSPRPMRIDAIERDLDELFCELVAPAESVAADTAVPEPTLLAQTFARLARLRPECVFIKPELHVQNLGISIQPDYAYRNGGLNVVQEMPKSKGLGQLQSSAFALSKEGELVRTLEEGEGKLLVVSSVTPRAADAKQRERAFGEMLRKLGSVEFVPSERVQEFTTRVETELSEH